MVHNNIKLIVFVDSCKSTLVSNYSLFIKMILHEQYPRATSNYLLISCNITGELYFGSEDKGVFV